LFTLCLPFAMAFVARICLLALFLSVCFASASLEPEPEPEVATSSSTTPAAPVPTHTIQLSVELSSVDSFASEADMRNKITQGLQNASAVGASVAVVIDSMRLFSVYGDLPTINVDDIAEAVANMSSVRLDQITVNGQRHSSLLRRLLETATCITTVNSSAGVDIVAEMQRIQGTHTAAAFTSYLRSINLTAYENANASLTSAPSVKVQVTTQVTGINAPPATTDIEARVAAVTGGTVAVTSVTSSGVVSTSSPAADLSYAPVAPMMTIWALAYTFATQ